MFTTVIHPDTGHGIQFKCGYDDCETYRLDEPVNWKPNPDVPLAGKLLDDVYAGEACYHDAAQNKDVRAGRFWVVIKDHVIKAVVPYNWDGKGQLESDQRARLYASYGIHELPYATWSEKAWADEAKRRAQVAAEELLYAAEVYGIPLERRIDAVNAFARRRMRAAGFYERIMPPVPITEDAP